MQIQCFCSWLSFLRGTAICADSVFTRMSWSGRLVPGQASYITRLSEGAGHLSLSTHYYRRPGCTQESQVCIQKLRIAFLFELKFYFCIKFLLFCAVCCRGLQRLDVSSLPQITNPGMVILLLEEMLPQCHITATGYDLSLWQEEGEGTEEQVQK